MKNNYIIYRVLFPNKKTYIGLTSVGLSKRKANHYYEVRMGSSLLFHKALRKYKGQEIWEILHEDIEFDKIAELEMIEIAKHNSTIDGYNLTYGGEGVRAVIVSKETRLKQSLAKLGKKSPERSDEWKRNISNSKKGEKNGMFGKSPPNKGISFDDTITELGRINFELSRAKIRKKIVMMDDNKVELLCFRSLREATEYCGLKSASSISDSIKKGNKCFGKRWKYLD